MLKYFNCLLSAQLWADHQQRCPCSKQLFAFVIPICIVLPLACHFVYSSNKLLQIPMHKHTQGEP